MMETGTFLQENVQENIKKNYIPLKYETSKDSEQFLRFWVRATPTYIILDSKGNEIHRMIGFYKPDDFIKELELARSKVSKSV